MYYLRSHGAWNHFPCFTSVQPPGADTFMHGTSAICKTKRYNINMVPDRGARRALQQIALNVHAKLSDLIWPIQMATNDENIPEHLFKQGTKRSIQISNEMSRYCSFFTFVVLYWYVSFTLAFYKLSKLWHECFNVIIQNGELISVDTYDLI